MLMANLLKANPWKTTTVATVSALLTLAPSVHAETVNESPSAGAMVADAVVARPLYFALSQIGSAVYAATLPFTLLGGNSKQAAETLVVTPLQGAFVRCLGCGKIDNQVSQLSEEDGSKRIQNFIMLSTGVSMVDITTTKSETETPINFGAFFGTHFALSDRSRFDVMLGAKRLSSIDFGSGASKTEDTIDSYQLVSRFGRNLGGSTSLMFKLGGHYADIKRDSAAGGKSSVDGFNVLYGVGLDIQVSNSIRLGIEATQYRLPSMPVGYDNNYLNSVDANISFMF